MSEDVVDRLTRLVAGHGLNGGNRMDDGTGAGRPLGDADWRRFSNKLVSGKLTGLALAASTDGALPLTAEQEADLVEQHRARMVRVLLLERTLLDLSYEMERAGVPALVLKGSSFAYTAYPDPSWRDFDDLDLLVPTHLFARARSVLVESGCIPSSVEPRAGFTARFGKASVFRKGVFEIDLHRTLVLGPYSLWVDADRLFAEHGTFTVAGRTLRCLSPEHRLIHASMHAILGSHPPLPLALRDAAQIERAGGIDPDVLARDARSWRVEPVLARAVSELRDGLGVEAGSLLGAFNDARAGRRERKAIRAYLDAGHVGGRTSSSMIRALPGVRPKLAYLAAIVLPDKDFLAHHTGATGSRWRAYPRRWGQLLRIFRRRRRRTM
jgi:hypothetical protein